MDKIKIEDYRGFEIMFDKNKELFSCMKENWNENDSNKKSFSAIKKYIDDFLKDNFNFKEFWIEGDSDNQYKEKIKVIGIRKDGRFVYESSSGEKKQLAEYDEKDYILFNPENEKWKLELNKIEEKIKSLNKEKKSISSNITGTSLRDYKKTITY